MDTISLFLFLRVAVYLFTVLLFVCICCLSGRRERGERVDLGVDKNHYTIDSGPPVVNTEIRQAKCPAIVSIAAVRNVAYVRATFD